MTRTAIPVLLSCILAGCEPSRPRVWDIPPVVDPNAGIVERALAKWESDLKLEYQRQAAVTVPWETDALEMRFKKGFPTWREQENRRLRKILAPEILRQIATIDGWEAAAERLRDPSFQREMCLSVVEAGELMKSISSFQAMDANSSRNSPGTARP